MEITPYNRAGASKTGSLSDRLTVADITAKLGFGPNVADDPDKVTASWGFKVDGEWCGIWDYKGWRWSTWGPRSALAKVFGEENVR